MGSPAAPTRREGLPAGRGHAKRRVRALPRNRAKERVAHPVVLALEAEPTAAKGPAQDLDRLVEPPLALRVGDRVALVEPGEAAPADPEVDPPAAHVVEGRDLLRDPDRVVQGQHVHRETDPDAAGASRDRGREGDRRGEHRTVRDEVELREPGRIEPPGVGRLGKREALPERVRLAAPGARRELHEHPELHRCGLLLESAENARTPEDGLGRGGYGSADAGNRERVQPAPRQGFPGARCAERPAFTTADGMLGLSGLTVTHCFLGLMTRSMSSIGMEPNRTLSKDQTGETGSVLESDLHRADIGDRHMAAVRRRYLSLLELRKVQLNGDMLRNAERDRTGIDQRAHRKGSELTPSRVRQAHACINPMAIPLPRSTSRSNRIPFRS